MQPDPASMRAPVVSACARESTRTARSALPLSTFSLSAGLSTSGSASACSAAASSSAPLMIAVRGTGRSCSCAKHWNEALLASRRTLSADGSVNRYRGSSSSRCSLTMSTWLSPPSISTARCPRRRDRSLRPSINPRPSSSRTCDRRAKRDSAGAHQRVVATTWMSAPVPDRLRTTPRQLSPSPTTTTGIRCSMRSAGIMALSFRLTATCAGVRSGRVSIATSSSTAVAEAEAGLSIHRTRDTRKAVGPRCTACLRAKVRGLEAIAAGVRRRPASP